MRRAALGLAAAFLAAAVVLGQPSNVSGTRITARPAGGDFTKQVRALAAEPGTRWIGWSVPSNGDGGQMCCWDTWNGDRGCCGICRLDGGRTAAGATSGSAPSGPIALEPRAEVEIFARVEAGAVRKVRTLSTDCAIEAGDAALAWITGVPAEKSLELLEALLTPAEGESDVGSGAVAAIALHAGPAADRALERLATAGATRSIRKNAIFWLGNARGRAGFEVLSRLSTAEPSPELRKQVTFALTQTKEPEAIPTLIAMARHDPAAEVRGQALFWLAQKAGRKASKAIDDAIQDDPDTEVKTKAVFALTQMPDNEGVPKLIEVARSNRNREVRKKAMFWLGQSKDPRALAFFEEVLTR